MALLERGELQSKNFSVHIGNAIAQKQMSRTKSQREGVMYESSNEHQGTGCVVRGEEKEDGRHIDDRMLMCRRLLACGYCTSELYSNPLLKICESRNANLSSGKYWIDLRFLSV